MSGGEYLNLVILALFIAGATGYAFWLSKRADSTTTHAATVQDSGNTNVFYGDLHPDMAGSVTMKNVVQKDMAGGVSIRTARYVTGGGKTFLARKAQHGVVKNHKNKKTPNSA